MSLKVTKNQSPEPPHGCPLSECMNILGGAWATNIIWFLSGGSRRFNELRVDIPEISAKVLTTRLRELEDKGVVAREVRPTSPPSVEYSLTQSGVQLLPAIKAIIEVGHQLQSENETDVSS